jgi:LysM repeat protein
MNNPNPLIPQGSLLQQSIKGKPHLRVAIFIVAVHLVFLGGLLIQGCKKEDAAGSGIQVATNNDLSVLPPLDRDSPYNTNLGILSTNPSQTVVPPVNNVPVPIPLPPVIDTPPPAASREYVVIKGDSFFSIGKKFGISANAIAKSNPGIDPTRLKVGDKLQLPTHALATTPGVAQATADAGTDVHIVKPGDTLGKIAHAHGTTINEIKALNGLKTDRINIGQKLKLPSARPTTAPSVPATGGTVTPLQPATPSGNP